MQHRDIVFLKGLLVLFMKDNLKYTLQHKIQIDANGQILSVLDKTRSPFKNTMSRCCIQVRQGQEYLRWY
jgi:hypothetical protein